MVARQDRDGDAEAGAGDAAAGAGAPDAPAGRRDPFAHGDLPQRPTYLPEEGEGGRSEVWSTLFAVAVAVAAIAFIGWLIGAPR